jgi:pimeloyl-ACP methyl ester carboxylesterase
MRAGRGVFIGLAAALALAAGPAMAAEQVVSIPGGKAPLFGTFERPEGAAPGPAVLILAGSGPTDRDGNSTVGGAPNQLKQLADALAAAGVASLRVDKRGIAASAAAAPSEADLRVTTYADDAGAWAAWLRGQGGVTCVVLAGHSEGALIAILAAQKTPVCGLVSLEGPGRTFADVLRAQLRPRLAEPLRSQALAAIDSLAAGKPVADPPPQLAALFRPSVQPYLISELSLDPTVEIKAVRAPVLLVQGEKDQQVGLEDFLSLKTARPDATAVLIPGMIHVLKLDPPAGQTGLTNLPLAPGLPEAVIRFVKSLPKPP